MLNPAEIVNDRSSDAELAQRMVAGDTNALECLMRRYNQSLYRAARSILKDEQDAEESVQDAYLKAYRNIGQFDGSAKLSTWLTRIAINEALARRRKHQRRTTIMRIDSDASAESLTAEDVYVPHIRPCLASSDGPEQDALRAEIRHLIECSIDKLPEPFRCVFVLRALGEMTVEETADCLGLPEATVRSRHFRARGLMREAIAREVDLSYEDVFGFDGARCDRIVADVLAQLAVKMNRVPPAGS
ncbi:RNA polymerase sigma factor [Alcanivorax sp. 24]|uniref:RNA polymerase sigma factor n=1 Tax=Alcanivorax sp. 24 TaxID=2545266 RepID=UPI00105EC489|nr:RNA polymerase sigma factor [Alcanivorax sp. 24]